MCGDTRERGSRLRPMHVDNLFGDPFMMEANAALNALKFASHMGFTSIELEGDAFSIIKKQQSHEPNLSTIRLLIDEVRVKAFNFQFM
ncbi:hypothetical protein CRYUN_Cryun10bG0173300 [Craigia yunnanensis]